MKLKFRYCMISYTIFISACCLALAYGAYTIDAGPESTLVKVFAGVASFMFACIIFFTFKDGPWYYANKYLCREGFNKVVKTKNLFILIDKNNNSHIFGDKIDELNELGCFKARFYYNLSKFPVRMRWRVYEELNELRKGIIDDKFAKVSAPPPEHWDSVG